LGISTLAAASDLTFRIALYVLFKLAIVPGLYTVMYAQELFFKFLFGLPTTTANLAQAKTLATELYRQQ
jgi:hypothetical protein